MRHALRFHDWLVLLLILLCAAWARFSQLENVGVRTADEGSYCFFAITMLNGERACIQDKPGQALILAAGLELFGLSQFGATLSCAILGLATVPVLFWLGFLMRGKTAAVTLASIAAFLPYFLYYNRSAASDTNYLFSCFLGLCFYLRGLGPACEKTDALKTMQLFWAGFCFGLGATVNLAAIPPAALAWAYCGYFCYRREPSLRRSLECLGTMAAGVIAGAALVVLALVWFIDFPKVATQFFQHAGHILGMDLKWGWAFHLWEFVGLAPLALAAVGLLAFRLWWRTPLAVFPLISLVLAFFYARASLSLPRLHVPILLGVIPMAGMGADAAVSWMKSRFPRLPDTLIHAVLAVALLSLSFSGARRIVSLRSGYPEACQWLSEHIGEQEKGIGTHTWWTFVSFTGRVFSYGGYTDEAGEKRGIAEALNQPGWRKALAEELRHFEQNGYSWLVMDYLLFTRLVQHWRELGGAGPPAGIESWRALVGEFPPEQHGGAVFANAIAADYETRAEDAYIPPLENEPLGQAIYVYRIADLLAGIEPTAF